MRVVIALMGTGLALAATAGAVRPTAHPPPIAEVQGRPTDRHEPRLRRRRGSSQRQRAAVAAAFPDAIELIVLAVRAGYLPAAAVRAVLVHLPGAVQPSFSAVIDRVDRGARFADALGELHQGLGPIADPLVDSFAATDRYGLPLTPVLARLADDARRQRRRAVDIAARQLPIRLAAPLVLCTLPSFILLAVVPLLLSALSSLEW